MEENCRKVKDEISQSIECFFLELQLRKKCLFEEVDAMESSNKDKVRLTIKFTNGDKNVVLSAIRNFGVVSSDPQLTSGDDLSPEGVPRGTTGGLPTSDQSSETDELSSAESDSIAVSDKTGSLSDQSSETDETSSADSDSIDVSDETEMKNLSDAIVMFPQRCLSKCKNVYQGEIISRVLSNRTCAIKFPQDTDQSNKEVEILEKLGTHMHVVSLIQSGVVDSIFKERFLVLELCCEDDLNQYLTNNPYNFQLNLRYCIQIIKGMKYIHDKCIIHKDLKPANILLTLDQQIVKIADFGISQGIKSERSMVFCEYRFGTVGYRPPESFGNAYISLKSDIFSLGALFHFIMSDGKSSFGPEPDLRDSNIIKGNVRVARLFVPNPNTFSHLFKLMMSKERRYRPTIWQIEDHPCWRLEEHDCEFDYGRVDEIDDSSDERAHSPQVEVVDPLDEFANLSETIKILEAEEERIYNNKNLRTEGYCAAMSSGGSADNFAVVCYEEMAKIKNTDWLKFARRKLNIPEIGIADITTDYRDDIREQKFQMVQFWMSHRKNRDCNPSVALRELVSDFQASTSEFESAERRSIKRYRNKGLPIKYFGTKGKGPGQMNDPHGICSTASDDIVVADYNNHRIQIFDVNGRFKGIIGSKGKAEGKFNGVVDMCVTSRGHIVASDKWNHRIQIFDERGKFVREFGGRGSGDGKLNCPGGVATDASGLIYVCDTHNGAPGNHRVQVFSEEGKFVRKLGSESLEVPSFLSVTSDGRVVVSDWRNERVQVFDSHGRHLFHFGSEGSGEGQFKDPACVATDDHGNMIVCDRQNHRVQIFTSNGEFVASFGSWGSRPGQMKDPTGVCVLSDGRIAVGDTSNHRVQIF